MRIGRPKLARQRSREWTWGRKARFSRRGMPIHAYVGPNGGGKSLAMVYDTLPTLDGVFWECDLAAHAHTQDGVTSGRRMVLSTCRLLGEDGEDHPAYVRFSDYRQLLVAEHCDVLMDEVTGIASSRESNSMPVQVANFLVQLRRRDVLLRWTSPNFARADKIMREVTQAVTYCRGFAPARRHTGQQWRPKRAFWWRTYDAMAFDEFSAHKRETLRSECRQFLWRPGNRAERAYNTLDAVETLGTASDAGLCMVCGGRRSHPKCSCVHGDADAALDALDGELGSELGAAVRTGPQGRRPRTGPQRPSRRANSLARGSDL